MAIFIFFSSLQLNEFIDLHSNVAFLKVCSCGNRGLHRVSENSSHLIYSCPVLSLVMVPVTTYQSKLAEQSRIPLPWCEAKLLYYYWYNKRQSLNFCTDQIFYILIFCEILLNTSMVISPMNQLLSQWSLLTETDFHMTSWLSLFYFKFPLKLKLFLDLDLKTISGDYSVV